MIKPLGREFSHCFAWFLSENGNNLILITSSVAPFILNVSQISKKFSIFAFGSSSYSLSNYTNCYTIWMMFGLTSKLLAAIVSLILPAQFQSRMTLHTQTCLLVFSMFSNCISSRFNPNTSALSLILALRFLRVVLLIFESSITTSKGLLLVINKQRV